MKKKLELLAPAGDIDSLYAAIYNGADAVYLGLSDFNARIKADNFNQDNIRQVVEFAHLYGVKIYLTINTLIKDDEVEDFLRLVDSAVAAKVDAFIIQDLGMAMLLKNKYRGIVLHASTQMGVHNLAGAKILQHLGFSRIVLARETKLQDIKDIADNTNLEIEYFVQGALCVAFSGNCYLSAIKNGNSGNRGKCLQLCRLPYKLYRGDKLFGQGYYMSPRDLSLMKEIDNLAEAGVCSLKIEGRLKRASYVAQAVRSYRKILNNYYYDNMSDYKAEQEKIKSIFSRGDFNETAYLYDNFDIINIKDNSHKGKLIGKVIKVANFKDLYRIVISSSTSLGQGDAIKLIKGKDECSIGVGNVNIVGNNLYEIFSKNRPQVDSEVYLLKRAEAENKLMEKIKKLPINLRFAASVGTYPVLIAKYGNTTVEVVGDRIAEKPVVKATNTDTIIEQLSKLNDTPFVAEDVQVDVLDVYLPLSEINELRRKVVSELKDTIIRIYEMAMPKVVRDNENIDVPILPKSSQNYVIVDGLHCVKIPVEYRGYNVIIAPNIYSKTVVDNYINSIMKQGYSKEKLYLELPIVSTDKEIEIIDEIVAEQGIGVVANNYSGLKYIGEVAVIAGTGLNVHNKFTANVLLGMGVLDYIYSIETGEFSKGSGAVYAMGHFPLMTWCHCPFINAFGGDCSKCKYASGVVLEDDKHNRYRIRRYKIEHCYFQLLSEDIIRRKFGTNKLVDLRGLE